MATRAKFPGKTVATVAAATALIMGAVKMTTPSAPPAPAAVVFSSVTVTNPPPRPKPAWSFSFDLDTNAAFADITTGHGSGQPQETNRVASSALGRPATFTLQQDWYGRTLPTVITVAAVASNGMVTPPGPELWLNVNSNGLTVWGVDGSNLVRAAWVATKGKTYTLESGPEAAGPWKQIYTQTAASNAVDLVTVPSQARGFFRLQVQ